ncbi:MAG TPA: stage V sporulation protein T [Candidatus Avamphibacillus sp.]|nr:stage V sporulation protein T [Candidatus Avamphibacillus sp.]
MKATGIVRRIDDLGRVVIPKEIRRTLRIREGDPLEIFIDREGEVILKKYSPINELGNFAEEYADALFDSLQSPVLISDRDEIIAVAGESKKEYLNKKIGSYLEEVIENRTLKYVDESSTIEIIANKEQELSSYCIAPIIANGDPIGCVLIFSVENTFDKTEEKAAETAASFLGKQME